jgi:cephalosporin hydroxylase
MIDNKEISKHFDFVAQNIQQQKMDKKVAESTKQWFLDSVNTKYSYNFTYLGRPIIQYPQDIVAFQEIVWQVQPDLIIETGIAHGGSLILSASLLALLDLCEGRDAREPHRKVIGIDIDIREHNREALDAHPLRNRIELIQGSSIDPQIVKKVHTFAKNYDQILVSLDSNHTHEHVLAELEAYSNLVTPESYCIVFDTVIEDLPEDTFQDRPWGKGDNPKTAVWEFLKTHPEFEIDREIQDKLLITVAPDGFLKKK